jgi:hypothetical protein
MFCSKQCSWPCESRKLLLVDIVTSLLVCVTSSRGTLDRLIKRDRPGRIPQSSNTSIFSCTVAAEKLIIVGSYPELWQAVVP